MGKLNPLIFICNVYVENSVRWMTMVILSQLLFLNKLFKYMKKSSLLLVCVSFCIGVPTGLIICEILQIISDLITVTTTAFICTVLVAVALCVWLESSLMEKQVLTGIGLLTVLICLIVLLTYLDTNYMSLLLILLLMTSLSLSIIFKLHSLRNQSIHLTKDGDVKISKLPMIGNVFTLISMFASTVFSPWPLEYWVPTCSSLLILLQEDHYLLKSNFRGKHNLTPSLIIATGNTFVFTLYHCQIWSSTTWSTWLSGLMELVICILILPVFINYWTILWNNKFYISDYYTVFVLPLNLILILVGSSYVSYVLCILGILIGSWLMKEKLPLLR